MQTIEFEGRDIQYPGSWDEMSQKHLIAVSCLLLQGLQPDDFKMKLVLKWMGIERRLFNYANATWYISGIYRLAAPLALWGIKKGRVKSFDYSDAALLAETMSFLLTEHKHPDGRLLVERNNCLTKQLFPVLKAGASLYGPEDRMKNITAGEFAKAENRYQSYLNTGDEKYLNEMIAIMYRPRKRFAWLAKFIQQWDGEKRVPYHDYHMARAKDISGIDIRVRFAILLWFEGCRNLSIEKHPHVFSSTGGDNEDSKGWAGIFQAISEKPTEIEQIANLNFWTLLFDLEQRAIQTEKMKGKDDDD